MIVLIKKYIYVTYRYIWKAITDPQEFSILTLPLQIVCNKTATQTTEKKTNKKPFNVIKLPLQISVNFMHRTKSDKSFFTCSPDLIKNHFVLRARFIHRLLSSYSAESSSPCLRWKVCDLKDARKTLREYRSWESALSCAISWPNHFVLLIWLSRDD